MSLRTEYDAWHQRVFQQAPEHEDASSPWYQLVREKIGSVAGLRVLEVACGRGGFVRELVQSGAYVTGCDFSLAALRIGREKPLRAGLNGDGRGLVQGDAQKLPFGDSSFDLVISCETIEHVPDAQSALREMRRVTRPGGKLFLTTPNYLNFMGLYELYAYVRHPGRESSQPLDRRYLSPRVRQLVRRAGWTILHTDGTVHQFPFIAGQNPVSFPSLERNHTLRKLLSPLALHYFVMAQKQETT